MWGLRIGLASLKGTKEWGGRPPVMETVWVLDQATHDLPTDYSENIKETSHLIDSSLS